MLENDASNIIAFRQKKTVQNASSKFGTSDEPGIEHVNIIMIQALTEHVACELEIDQTTVEAMVKTAFSVRSLEELRKCDLENIGKYLVSLLDEHVSR